MEPDAAAAGVREWLAAVPATDGSRRAAAFDTRLDKPLSGGAAPRIARQLRWFATKSLPTLKTSSTRDMAGPRRAGELDRAATWGARLIAGWADYGSDRTTGGEEAMRP